MTLLALIAESENQQQDVARAETEITSGTYSPTSSSPARYKSEQARDGPSQKMKSAFAIRLLFLAETVIRGKSSCSDEGLTLETSVQNHFNGVKLIYINLKLIHYTWNADQSALHYVYTRNKIFAVTREARLDVLILDMLYIIKYVYITTKSRNASLLLASESDTAMFLWPNLT